MTSDGHNPEHTAETSNTPADTTTIGRFRMGARIGAGGMGEVYSATDPELGRRVAIKLLPAAASGDEEYQTRLKREAHAAARLNHPNIVTIYEMGDHNGQPYIVMEHVEGQTLSELVTKGPLELERVIEIGAQVAAGLRKAHESGVIHRDIKASNIIVDHDGRARILDFGLAVVSGAMRMTQPGCAMGTPMYMSPEQVEGREVDARSDLFALGVVLYELLTGTCPFKRETKSETIAAVLGATPEPIAKLRPDAPAELVAIIERLIEKDPRARYASASDLYDDLDQLRAGTQTMTISSPGSNNRPWRLVLAAVAVVAIVIGVGTLLNSGSTSEQVPKLVVLPFETIGPESERVVAAAITEEITNQLSSAKDLDVISRTTARRYRGTTLSISEIATELGVTHVLEGTVTWGRGDQQSSRARISSSLIRVSDDTPVWQNTFERNMDDVFAVQREIARSVASALSGVLGEESEPPGGTTNLEAHRLFISGLEYLERPDPYVARDAMVATELLRQAVDLDPEFARAWAELAMAHASLSLWGHDRTTARAEMLRSAAERAVTLAPNLAEAHVAMAQVFRNQRSYDEALAALDRAFALRPNSVRALIIKASILATIGRHDAAEDEMRRAIELNPQDSKMVHDIGDVYMLPRQYDKADEFYGRSISLAPDQVLAYACQVENNWLWHGDLARGREILAKMPYKSDPRTLRHLFRQELFARDFEAALAIMDDSPMPILTGPLWYLPVQTYRGQALELLGREAEAREAFEESIAMLEPELELEPSDDRILAALALCYAKVGRAAQAIETGKRAVAIVPYELNSLEGAERLHDLAKIYASVGEQEKAIELLKHLLNVPAFITPNLLRIDPRWNSIRDHPGFMALVNDGEPSA